MSKYLFKVGRSAKILAVMAIIILHSALSLAVMSEIERHRIEELVDNFRKEHAKKYRLLKQSIGQIFESLEKYTGQYNGLQNCSAKSFELPHSSIQHVQSNIQELQRDYGNSKDQNRLLEAFTEAVGHLQETVNELAAKLLNLEISDHWEQPIPFFTSNRTIRAVKGDDVEIWCVARGTPLPEIEWTRHNGILGFDRVVFGNNQKVLRIRNVQLTDKGSYTCIASNGVGPPVYQSASLEVHG